MGENSRMIYCKCDTCKYFFHREHGDRGALRGVCEKNKKSTDDFGFWGLTQYASQLRKCKDCEYEKGDKGVWKCSV